MREKVAVIKKHKLIFIPIPKNANSFMKYFIYNTLIYPENNIQNIRLKFNENNLSNNINYQLLSKEEIDNYRKNSYHIVIFIRNPINRSISQFNDKKNRIAIRHKLENIDFTTFLKCLNIDKNIETDHHFMGQFNFIKPFLSFDNIYFYNVDNGLDIFLKDMKQIYGLTTENIKINEGFGINKELLTNEQMNLIYEIFSDDFKFYIKRNFI